MLRLARCGFPHVGTWAGLQHAVHYEHLNDEDISSKEAGGAEMELKFKAGLVHRWKCTTSAAPFDNSTVLKPSIL